MYTHIQGWRQVPRPLLGRRRPGGASLAAAIAMVIMVDMFTAGCGGISVVVVVGGGGVMFTIMVMNMCIVSMYRKH